MQLSGITTEPIESIVAEVHDSTQLVAMTNRTGAFSRGEVVEVTVGGLSLGTQYTAVAYDRGQRWRCEGASVNTRLVVNVMRSTDAL